MYFENTPSTQINTNTICKKKFMFLFYDMTQRTQITSSLCVNSLKSSAQTKTFAKDAKGYWSVRDNCWRWNGLLDLRLFLV